MSLVIFGDRFTFPEGNAATNRVYTYAKGCVENDLNVTVVCFGNDFSDQLEGVTEGISFYNLFGIKTRKPGRLSSVFHKIIKYIKAPVLLKRLNKKEKILDIHLYTNRFVVELFLCLIARLIGTRITLERSEHPFQDFGQSLLERTKLRFVLGCEPRLFDGVICISNYLADFYHEKGFNENQILIIPSTVDTGRFFQSAESPLHFDYVFYCGSLTILKDGVDILIKSFSEISGKYGDLFLVLAGKGDTVEEETAVRKLVDDIGMGEKVIFLGQVPRNDIPQYLVHAKILALARPSSFIADAGFPSKLTEYLAAGKPAVVTKVGEIPYYLKDNETAFLVDPDDVSAFAGKLEFVLDNYDYALKIAERGKELTRNVFNYNTQVLRLIDFLRGLRVS
jgi:glycosyltransferase involved in cell wall biosynthesis